MSVTRRQFTIVATSAFAVAVVGCDTQPDPPDTPTVDDGQAGTDKAKKKNPHASKLAKEPFLIGSPDDFVQSGVYRDYEDKGVWIISDGRILVALSSTCPHLACATGFDQPNEQFLCPCHGSRFDLMGTNAAGSKAKRPLERCALRQVQGQIEVDPTRRFRKEKGQWSDPASSLNIGQS